MTCYESTPLRPVLVTYQFNIYLTEVGAMHEAGYGYSIRSAFCHFPFKYFKFGSLP